MCVSRRNRRSSLAHATSIFVQYCIFLSSLFIAPSALAASFNPRIDLLQSTTGNSHPASDLAFNRQGEGVLSWREAVIADDG